MIPKLLLWTKVLQINGAETSLGTSISKGLVKAHLGPLRARRIGLGAGP